MGALGGAALSAHLSGSFGDGVGVAPWAGFIGGTMMLFGARMASGCTRYVATCLCVVLDIILYSLIDALAGMTVTMHACKHAHTSLMFSMVNSLWYSQTPLSQLELFRTPALSSVLLSIACISIAHMLFESVRMPVYYLQQLKSVRSVQ